MSSVTERTLVTDLAGLPDVPGGDRAAVVGHDWVRGPRLGCGQVRPTGWRSWSWRRSAIPWPGLPPGCPTAVLLVMLWFLFPGMAEQVSPEDDWAFFRRWAWDGVRLGQDPDLDRAGRRPIRPGALVAGLT